MAVASIMEYSASIDNPQLVKAKMLIGGKPIKKNGRQIKYSGGFCVVFPFEINQIKYAVRCWHININDIKQRTKVISEAIKKSKLSYFVGFEYISDGLITAQGAQDIVVMDWVDAKPLKKYLADNIYQQQKIRALTKAFKDMVADLHAHHLAHGDLQHGNILVKEDGKIVLVDYDSIYTPDLKNFPDDIKGLVGYQHPARWKNNTLSEKLDYFSELIIYTSLLVLSKYPNLWFDLDMENTETLLFSAEDISSNGNSRIFQFLEGDEELKPLLLKIKDFLKTSTIDDLEPLEEVLIKPETVLTERLSRLWEDNGYKKGNSLEEKVRVTSENISKRW